MDLSDLQIIQAELSPGPALNIIAREIRKIEAKDTAKIETYKRLCQNYGLRPDQFGKVFPIRGVLFRITGINPGAPRYPIDCERVYDGKAFRAPAALAKVAS